MTKQIQTKKVTAAGHIDSSRFCFRTRLATLNYAQLEKQNQIFDPFDYYQRMNADLCNIDWAVLKEIQTQ